MALARYLVGQGAAVVVSDQQPPARLQAELDALSGLPLEFALGGHPQSLLDGADVLCISGGVPLDIPIVQAARERAIPLSNDAQIFLERCPAMVLGVTGSAGKTTTTTLLGRMATAAGEAQGFQVFVGGNIGRPLLLDLERISAGDLVVMELSSFQLELMEVSPAVAAVLNITPNHLDRHGTMQAYTAAKARILDFQSEEDTAVLGRDDPGAWNLRERVHGQLVTFGRDPLEDHDGVFLEDGTIMLRRAGATQPVIVCSEIQLRGEHNRWNVMAACAIAAAGGLTVEVMRTGIAGFRGVAHRLEFVRSIKGADWYNDSIATTPERAIAALRSFDAPIVLLAGGRDKKLSWETFAQVAQSRVHHLVVFGEASQKIRAAVEPCVGSGCLEAVLPATDLEEAVRIAHREAQVGDVVLLAPGGTSYDAYKDFEARGEHFRRLVNAI